ncbi:hypothetical protein H6P81_016412 [Aristolochia fimbriata]|uniref:Retrovirus-related Pol polyprotein from transposon TNT 1-94 n=1 Tax=Aristolochia fimbriata TaxID=158543 RepID=A0AAV7E8A1_ARIFI|nr:hypothetical protein H6P81_016412 [Aristolochia fimbriata]
MAEKSSKTGKIEKFDGSNYQWWRMQIEDHLYEKQLHLPLIGVKPAEMKADEWALLDRRALAVVWMSLTQSIAFNVSKEKTVKDLLTALAGVYEKSSASNRLFLLRKLVYLRMTEGTPIADHLNDFNKLWAQIEAVDLKFDDDVKALMFMCSLPESWDTVITSISNATKEKLKFDEVLSAILNQEMMKRSMVSNTSSTSDTALSVDKGKGRDRGRNQSRGANNRDRSKSKGKSKGKFKCWVCDKEGHVKRDCPERVKNTANVVDGHEEKLCLLVYDEYKVENWYINSGASFHCTSHKEWFCDYIKGEFGHVIVRNGQKCKIEGRGIIHLKMNDGGKLILKEVRHIPDLQKNLISVNKLDQEGYKITFENSSWKVSRGTLTLIKGKAVGTLYPLCTKVDQIVSLAAEKDDKASLWHRRLGKQKQVSFNKDGRKKKSNRLDLVHTDVWGLAQGKSFGGNLYFVIFIDDYSRKTWIYTLKEKSNVFNMFKYWLARVENETGSRLKCLLSDNGGEFCNKEFDSYCAKRGIRRIKTVPRTPQQNGVAERMNRTILERARSMRIHAGLPLHLWGATVDTAVYLINRSPSSALDGRILEEAWAGKNVDYSFLKIFDCIAYAHIDREVRKKLDPKSTKCVFLGYGGEPESYDEAMADEAHLKWELAMKDEMLSLEENQTWELVKMPAKKKVLQNKWIFRVKQEAGGVQRYKARLVVKGFGQKEGIDFHDIFAPVVKMTSIRTILSIVAVKGLYLEQFDVKTTFLHGDLEEEIYMRLPAGFEVIGKESWVKRNNFLGCKLPRDKKKKKLWLSQEGYVKKVLERFNMHESKAVTTTLGSQFKLSKEQGAKSDEEIAHMKTVPYASTIGSLMYAMVSTRPDIAHAVGVVSRFMKNLGKEHWEAVKWIFRYLKGTSDYCLCFGENNIDVKGFVDSNHAGDRDNGRSTSGYVFTIGGTAVSWVSKLQKVVALSSTEAEYVAATEASKEYIWLKSLMNELGFDNADCRLYIDSQSAIHLAKNSAFHSRTKHIHLRYHFIRTLLEEGQLKLEKDGKKNSADMLTKPVEGQKLSLCSTMVNLH